MISSSKAEGYAEIVKLLITNPYNPANVNLDSEWVYCGIQCITRPIWVAVKSKNLKLPQLLLWKASVKVDLEYTNTFVVKGNGGPGSKQYTFDCTPLRQAVRSEQESMVNELIKAGTNVNAACTIIWCNGPVAGHTTDFLITLAVSLKDIGLCCRLVQHSCSLNARKTHPKGGLTAVDLAPLRRVDPNKMPQILIHAYPEGYLEMVKLFITNPFNPANVNPDSKWVYRGVPCITQNWPFTIKAILSNL